MARAPVAPPASRAGGAERASIPMSVLIESLSPLPHSVFEVSFPVFFLGLGMLLFPVLCTAVGRWSGFRRHIGMPALLTQGAEEGEEEQERLRVRAYTYLDSNSQLFAENQRLREALTFYAAQENWQSPSTDFERRYNPRPSAVDLDGGQRAHVALTEPRAADARQ